MRTLRKLAAALLIVMLAAPGAFAVVYGQAGYETYGYDESTAWEINSAAVLIKVRDDINSGKINTEKYYRLTADIDLSSYTDWTPIGPDEDSWNYSKTPFNGVFDGGNHTITLNIARTNQNYTGLFGVVNGGTIKNLKVKGKVRMSNSGSSYASSGGYDYYVGGIVAYILEGTIDSCTFDGTVTGSNTGYRKVYVGGIAGANRWGKTVITNCKVGSANTSTSIKSSAPSTYSYGSGIIGYFKDYSSSNEISYNYSRATVEAGNFQNLIYGYRDGTSGRVFSNTEKDPSEPDEPSVEPVAISTYSLSSAYLNQYYSETLSATGTTPITWSVSSGSLPSGLYLSSSGTISGTPTSAGTYYFTVNASNSSTTATASYSIQVIDNRVAPTISSGSYLGQFTLQDYVSIQLYANGTEPLTWAVTGGSLPSGLYMSSDGQIYGTISSSGTHYFTITVSNAVGNASREFQIDVPEPYITITTTYLYDGTVDEYYSDWLYATGYNLPSYSSWEWSASGLPSGLYIDSSSGEISGTPWSEGTYTVTVTATNGGYSASKSYTITIDPADEIPPSITTSSLPDAKLNKSYSVQLEAESDTSVTWDVYGLPDGLDYTSSGYIAGTPTVSGSYWISIYAENEGGTDSRYFILNVLQPTGIEINSTNFPDETFRNYVRSNLDSDGDGWLDDSEISAITTVNVYNFGISSVKGIEHFTELTSLTVWSNYITELDISNNTKLTYLDCDSNQLTELDVSNNPLLRTIYCQYNQLSQLNLYNNYSLKYLYCANNQLYSLNVSSCSNLETISCYSNNLRALNLTGNPNLTMINISDQSTSGLSVTKYSGSDYYSAELSTILGTDTTLIYAVGSDVGTAEAFDSVSGRADFVSLPSYVVYDYNTGFTGTDGTSSAYMKVYVYPNDEPSFVTQALPNATQGSYYYTRIDVSSKTSTTLALYSGTALPAGLTFDSSTGEIYGTPLYSGTYSFTVTAYNDYASYGTYTASYTITVDAPAVTVYAPSITTSSIPSGTIGSYYYAQIYADGTSPFTWSVSGLPSGMYMTGGGYIYGTPYEAGTFYVTVTASNTSGSSSMSYNLTITGSSPSITTYSVPDGRINVAYSTQLTADGTGVSWYIESGNLPAGLSLGSDGTISGTPTEEGTFTFTACASNTWGSDSRTYTLDIDGVAPTITTTEISSGRVNDPYSFQFSASGSGTISWSYSGSIPSGLVFTSDGLLSGTPTESGRFAFSVIAENVSGSDSRSFTLVIDAPAVIAPSITTGSLPQATVDTAYSAGLSATGTAPITWFMSSDLPAGLSLSESGTISGTPTLAGTFKIIVAAMNASGYANAAVKEFTLTVNGIAPEITTASTDIPAGLVGVQYSASFSASGTNPITWSYSGKLPGGLTLSETGELSGTPTEAGTFNVAVTASNIAGEATKTFTLTVNASAPKITTESLPSGMINTAYSAELKADGINLVWNASGTLPEGISVSPEGIISGTPKNSGSFDITITAENSAGSDSKNYTLFIDGFMPSIKISGKQNGVVGKSYSALIETSGTKPVTLSVSSGNLPAGLTLNSDERTISGTFTRQGEFTFELEASNVAGSVKQSFTITVQDAVQPVIKTKKLPDGYNGEEYKVQLEADGYVEEWRIDSGTLPNGLELDPNTGEISGVIDTSKATTIKFKVVAGNSDMGDSTAKQLSIKVISKTPQFKTEALKAAKWHSSYSMTLKLSNFKATEWSLIGDLPDGITFSKGKFSGKPNEVGEYEFTVIASNGAVEVVQDFELVVNGIPPKLKGSFKSGSEGVAYTSVLKATGTTPIEWDFETLPDGLDFTVDETGETCTISGTPEKAFSDKVLITLSNGSGDDDAIQKSLKMTIKAVKPKFKTKANDIPVGYVGEDYSYQLELSAGPANVDWSYTGNMPEGLEFDSDTGLIYGTPEESGKFKFTVTAKHPDKASMKSTLKITLTVNESNADKPAEKTDNSSTPEAKEADIDDSLEFVDGIAYHESGVLNAETLARVTNSGEIIVATLPAFEVNEERLYEFTVELDEAAEEGMTLVWHSFPDGEDDPDDSEKAYFLDGDNEMIEAVPENRTVTVNAWLVPGVVYEPVIAVKISD